MTPYTSAEIKQKWGRMRRQCRLFKKYIRKYRVCNEHLTCELKCYRVVASVLRHPRPVLPKVCNEHLTCELKCYRVVASVWRHPRPVLPKVVKICASLVCRRKEIGIVMQSLIMVWGKIP